MRSGALNVLLFATIVLLAYRVNGREVSSTQARKRHHQPAVQHYKKLKTRPFPTSPEAPRVVEAYGDRQCWTGCPANNNDRSIIEIVDQGSAGMSDRVWIMSKLGNIARYLCARIVVPPPCQWLDARHNNFLPVDCDQGWDFYWNATFEDGSSIFASPTELKKLENSNKFAVVTPAPDTNAIEAQIVEAVEHVRAGRIFKWRWTQSEAYWTSYFDDHITAFNKHHESPNTNRLPWPLPNVVGEEGGCNYVNFEPSKEVASVAERALIDVLPRGQPYSTLHIRRSDATLECDTAIVKVREYLTCMTATHPEIAEHDLIFFTDEKDQTYLQQLKQLASGYFRQVLNGEALIAKELESRHINAAQNNYLIYEVGMYIQYSSAGVRLAMRRAMNCGRCGANAVVDDGREHGNDFMFRSTRR